MFKSVIVGIPVEDSLFSSLPRYVGYEVVINR